MGVDIVDYLTFPTRGEWKKFHSMIEDETPDLQFQINSKFNLLELINGDIEVNHWKSEFNWRIFNIGTNFVIMMHHYEKGIPDDQYENLKGEKLAVHYWFTFYAESLVSRILGAYDILFHIVNVKYDLEVEGGLGFNKKVLQRLSEKNGELCLLLERYRRETSYKKISELRNDFIHNNTPTNLDSGVKKDSNGVVSFSQGEYKKSSDVVKIIKDGLKHLQGIVKDFDRLL